MKSVTEVEVGPYRSKNILPVLAWNAGEKDFQEMKMVKEMGVNIVPIRIITPETNDWAARLGIYIFLHMSDKGYEGIKNSEDRILKVDGKTGRGLIIKN